MRYKTLSGNELLARRVRGVCLECESSSLSMTESGFKKDLCEGCSSQERRERLAAAKLEKRSR